MHRARGELVRLRGAQVSLCNLSLRGSSSMGISHTPLCSTDAQLHRRRSARAAAWGAPRLPHIPRLPYKPRRSYTSNLKPQTLLRAVAPSIFALSGPSWETRMSLCTGQPPTRAQAPRPRAWHAAERLRARWRALRAARGWACRAVPGEGGAAATQAGLERGCADSGARGRHRLACVDQMGRLERP